MEADQQQQPANGGGWHGLDRLCVVRILSFLPHTKDLMAVAAASRELRAVVRDSHDVWLRMLARDFDLHLEVTLRRGRGLHHCHPCLDARVCVCPPDLPRSSACGA